MLPKSAALVQSPSVLHPMPIAHCVSGTLVTKNLWSLVRERSGPSMPGVRQKHWQQLVPIDEADDLACYVQAIQGCANSRGVPNHNRCCKILLIITGIRYDDRQGRNRILHTTTLILPSHDKSIGTYAYAQVTIFLLYYRWRSSGPHT
jgi:hypothetical protein